MEQEFAAQAQGLSNTQRHSVVELEGVVDGLVLVLRITVGQINHRRRGSEVVGHLGGGRTVVQLVGKCKRLSVLLVEEMLEVEAAAERRARVFHIGCATICESVAIGSAAHCGLRRTGTLH